jgi:hypothetical protein
MDLAPIPGLRGTETHGLAVVVYQGHHDNGASACARCGQRTPCPARQHAASVILAAGEDPRWYDGRPPLSAVPAAQPRPGQRRGRDHQDTGGEAWPGYTGYRVGGRGRRVSPAGFLYERDTG